MPHQKVTAFYTTVVNTSGKTRSFGFLGKHGVRLDKYEQYTVPGELPSLLANAPRKLKGLERAITSKALAIISTPAALVYDATNKRTKAVVGVDSAGNTVVGVADPSQGLAYLGQLTGVFTAIPDGTSAVTTATLTFTAPVTGFDATKVVVKRGGSPVAQTLTVATADGGKTWTISGLVTSTNGNYDISVPHAGSGIADIYGNALSATPVEPWVKS